MISSEKLKDKMAEFPVIFFKRGDGEPSYVADGSWCASYRLVQNIEADIKDLGPTERFQVKRAFDFDGDNGPEMLEINDVLYLLKTDNSLKVIRNPMGC
jgi:hypothetical protein